MKKTVVELDLVGYNGIASTIEENIGSSGVITLNDQIRDFIDQGLSALAALQGEGVVSNTGDGAILILDRAEDAHHFAAAVHELTRKHNCGKTEPTATRVFRIGGATGDIMIRRRVDSGFDIAGVTIARAVRLETAARPGEFVVDANTFALLPVELADGYGDEVKIRGKRTELFPARRCIMNPEIPQGLLSPSALPEKEVSGSRRSILEFFERLHPTNLDRLMFLLELPISDQPSVTLAVSERESKLLKYSSGKPGGLEKLESELQYLLQKQDGEYRPQGAQSPLLSLQAPSEETRARESLRDSEQVKGDEIRIENSTVEQVAIAKGKGNIIGRNIKISSRDREKD